LFSVEGKDPGFFIVAEVFHETDICERFLIANLSGLIMLQVYARACLTDWFTCQKLTIFNCQNIEFLVFSRYSYTLPVWGPALWRLHNRSVRLTCDVRNYDRVSNHRMAFC